jgi:hypothetical protein
MGARSQLARSAASSRNHCSSRLSRQITDVSSARIAPSKPTASSWQPSQEPSSQRPS